MALEIGDLLLPFRQFFAEPLILLLQSFDLSRLAITCVARVFLVSRSLLALRLHQPERTASVTKVQV